MPVFTINGLTGSRPLTAGQMMPDQVELKFVDRLVFTTAAEMMRNDAYYEGAMFEKEQRVLRFHDRL